MMDYHLAKRLQTLQPSATLAVSAKANALRAQGRDIINLSVGEPDFDTPDFIKDAAKAALDAGFTKYTAVDGIAELKQAICSKLERDNALSYQAKEIVVTCGAKQAIYNFMQAMLNPGDEVLIPAPFWVSYPEMAQLAEATPVIIPSTQATGLKISAEQLERAITPKSRLIILNSPSNPSGLIYEADELEKIAKVLEKHPEIYILTDDIYEYIRWNGRRFVNILNVCPALRERTIVVNGVSKAYAMTGWRIGYAAGPHAIIKAMTDLQSQSTSNPNSIAQKAATIALQADPARVQPMVDAFTTRHALVLEQIRTLPGVQVIPAAGAFYSFPDFSAVIAALPAVKDDLQLAEYFLEEASVAMVPGTPFGCTGHLRISFATSESLLLEAFSRLRKALNAI